MQHKSFFPKINPCNSIAKSLEQSLPLQRRVMLYGSFSFQTSRKIVFRLSKFIAWSVTLLLIVHAILALSLMARLGLFMNVTAQLWTDKIYSFILLGTFEVQTRKTHNLA